MDAPCGLSLVRDHGQIDSRKAAVESISPVDAGLPGACSAFAVQRNSLVNPLLSQPIH
jgi:hypothetical protein